MGCDIHCYVEHRRKDYEHWTNFGARINPGRDYDVFGRLAGVRGDSEPVAPLRGLPSDVAYQAKGDAWLWIDYTGKETNESGYTTPEKAARYVSNGGCKYRGEVRPYTSNGVVLNADSVGKPQYVSHPDWHSHSWVTVDEWERAIGSEADPEYYALLAAMRELERRNHEVRVVFWFDN